MTADPALDQFWPWFRAHGDRVRAALFSGDVAARDAAVAELRDAVAEVEPNLTLEIGPDHPDGTHALVVSADGRPERVDLVKDFVAVAPPVEGWTITAFRPRMQFDEDIEIVLEDERVNTEDIWFRIDPNEDGLALTLLVRGLNEDNQRLRGLGASLMAQHAIGERDALLLLNSVEIGELPDDPDAEDMHPFGALSGVLDEERAQRYPPPGALPADLDEWMNLRGTADGQPIHVLLRSGLRPFAGHPDYDRSVVVMIGFAETTEDGMPANDEEYLAVQEIEDRISGALEEGQSSLLAVSLLTQGRREMTFYTSDLAAVHERLAAVQAQSPSHQIEVGVAYDSYWDRYRSFFPSEEEDESE